jgi:uncharacterized protein YabN with tetrapyrrole methylase and pyrophosphatase domain
MADPVDDGADPVAAALRLQLEAAAEGFDWSDAEGLWQKLDEETGELKAAATPAHRFEEFGDLLFMMINLARHLGIEPLAALQAANAKFAYRWRYILSHRADLPAAGPQRLEAMERLWTEAKRRASPAE